MPKEVTEGEEEKREKEKEEGEEEEKGHLKPSSIWAHHFEKPFQSSTTSTYDVRAYSGIFQDFRGFFLLVNDDIAFYTCPVFFLSRTWYFFNVHANSNLNL